MIEIDETDDSLLSSEEQELYEHFRFVLPKGQSLIRIDKYLVNCIEHATRNRIQNAIESGSVFVNEKTVKSSYKVKPLDVISIVLPTPPKDTEIVPENIPLTIVFEDDNILVVYKKPGMVVHPGYNNTTGTLVNALAWHFQDLPFAKENNIRPGLVHRIDKNTSGLLLIAKSEYAMTHLARQFFDHSIDREYYALVWGDVAQDKGTVSGYIGRSTRDRKVFQLSSDESKGKWSVTHYEVIERFQMVTLIRCKLETGRTHQIRVHMQSIGHPLFSDDTYGGDRIVKLSSYPRYTKFVENCFSIIPRQALHARSLGFTHPITNERLLFEYPLPEDFSMVLEKWRDYVKVYEIE